MATWFFVSAEPDRITRTESETDHATADTIDAPHYQSVADALDGIRGGDHGPDGPLYILKVEIETAAVVRRGWGMEER